MPNIVAPRGFVPSRYLNGSAWNGAFNTYYIPLADANAYSIGDVVKSIVGGDANGIPSVAKAGGNDTVRGVIVGFVVAGMNIPSLVGTNLDLTIQNVPAVKAKDYYAMVIDDPTMLFEIQDDGAAALTSSACNKNASFVVTNPTSPRQNSASTLSAASVAVTAGLALKLIGLAQKPNNAYGVNATWIVRFNQHEFFGFIGGA